MSSSLLSKGLGEWLAHKRKSWNPWWTEPKNRERRYLKENLVHIVGERAMRNLRVSSGFKLCMDGKDIYEDKKNQTRKEKEYLLEDKNVQSS